MPTERFLIELRDVVRSYTTRPALGPLSLAITQGELLVVVGPSGSGKTTLLRLIAGFEPPDAGTITIEAQIVANSAHWTEPEARGVGMVFQDYALFPHLTVAENIAFGLQRRDSARIRELLQLVGLAEMAQRYPHELSGGEQQRVALARSLASNPKVLLLDEPFSNLDADLRPKMRAELKLLLRRLNCTAIFVTHDQEEAFELADRVAVLNAGRLEQIDTPEQLYRDPATRFVAEFIGQAEFLTGRVRENCIETELGCFDLPAALPPETPVQVMFRPEDVELYPHPRNVGEKCCTSNVPPLPSRERVVPGEGERQAGVKLGIIVSRRYWGGVQLLVVRLPSGEAVRSLQPAGAHFPLAAMVGVRARVSRPPVFLGAARVPQLLAGFLQSRVNGSE